MDNCIYSETDSLPSLCSPERILECYRSRDELYNNEETVVLSFSEIKPKDAKLLLMNCGHNRGLPVQFAANLSALASPHWPLHYVDGNNNHPDLLCL